MNGVKFKIGYYYDMFSNDKNDWKKEAEYNIDLSPEFVEVLLEYPSGCSAVSDDECELLKRLNKSIPLTAHAPTINISLVAPNIYTRHASIKEHLAAIEIAQKLESPYLTIHGGEYPYYTPGTNFAPACLFNSTIKPILDEASRRGVTICLENLKGENIFPKTIAEMESVLTVNDGLMMAFDIRHFSEAGINPIHAYAVLKRWIKSIHYRVDSGLSVDELRSFLVMLHEDGFDGTFIIEDGALTSPNKADKSQIIAGREIIFSLLREITPA